MLQKWSFKIYYQPLVTSENKKVFFKKFHGETSLSKSIVFASKVLLLFVIYFSLHKVNAQEFVVPELKNHVNDYGNVLSRSAENQLNSILSQVKKNTTIELAVLTVNSLQGLPIEMASIKVTDQWQLGTAEGDKGLLLLLSIKDRKIRIEVGQGLEGTLTDVQSRRIIDYTMVPLLKSGDFTNAIMVGTFQMLQTAAPEVDMKRYYENIDERTLQNSTKRLSNKKNLFMILFWIVLIFFGGRSGFLPLFLLSGLGGRGYGGGGYRGGGGFGGGGGGLGGGGGFSGGGASGGW